MDTEFCYPKGEGGWVSSPRPRRTREPPSVEWNAGVYVGVARGQKRSAQVSTFIIGCVRD